MVHIKTVCDIEHKIQHRHSSSAFNERNILSANFAFFRKIALRHILTVSVIDKQVLTSLRYRFA